MHPRRVRHDVPAAPEAGLIVSIHAPAWGATSYQYVAGYVTKFQSTHPRGVRLRQTDRGGWVLTEFQSTHPRGVRRRQMRRSSRMSSAFQSTHPRGVRRTNLSRPPTPMLFQSTHPRGVRLFVIYTHGRRGRPGFNPRTRVGCDRPAPLSGRPASCFNPRTRVGCNKPLVPML